MIHTRTVSRSLPATAFAAAALLASSAFGQTPAPTFRLLTFEVGNSGPRIGATRGSGEQEVVDVHNAILALIKS